MRLEHIYRCQDGANTYWHKEVTEAGGFKTIIRTTEDHDFILTHDSFYGTTRLIEIIEPASRKSLMADGVDVSEHIASSRFGLFAEPVPVRLTSEARLTGNRKDIDGVALVEARVTSTMAFNAVQVASSGLQYLDPETGAFLSGPISVQTGASVVDYPGAPVAIIKPGEPGFLEDKGRYDCPVTGQARPDQQNERRQS
ncbi:MAG: hypothetical protein AB3N11_01330 [Arenibacterium sp.]